MTFTSVQGAVAKTCDVRYNGRQSITWAANPPVPCEDILLQHAYMPNGQRSSLDLEPNFDQANAASHIPAVVQNITIEHVVSDPVNSHVAAGGRGDVSHIVIRDMECIQNAAFGLFISTGGAVLGPRTDWLCEDWRCPAGNGGDFRIGSTAPVAGYPEFPVTDVVLNDISWPNNFVVDGGRPVHTSSSPGR